MAQLITLQFQVLDDLGLCSTSAAAADAINKKLRSQSIVAYRAHLVIQESCNETSRQGR